MIAILLNAPTHIENLSLSIAKENENNIQYRHVPDFKPYIHFSLLSSIAAYRRSEIAEFSASAPVLGLGATVLPPALPQDRAVVLPLLRCRLCSGAR
nr:hypothetical protein CFP56_51954 [Quercus suber]